MASSSIQWQPGGGPMLWKTGGGIAFDPACCCGGNCPYCAGKTPTLWNVSVSGMEIDTTASCDPAAPSPGLVWQGSCESDSSCWDGVSFDIAYGVFPPFPSSIDTCAGMIFEDLGPSYNTCEQLLGSWTCAVRFDNIANRVEAIVLGMDYLGNVVNPVYARHPVTPPFDCMAPWTEANMPGKLAACVGVVTPGTVTVTPS